MNQMQKLAAIAPENLPDLFYKDNPVITTENLAAVYGTGVNNIKKNYNRNKKKFEEGKHFFKLTGIELKEFRSVISEANLRVTNCHPQIQDTSQKSRSLVLWTDRGAARHSKMLNTDKAWDVWEQLEDNYFNRVPYGLIKGSGPASKEQKHNRIISVFTGSKRLAKEMGLTGDDAILLAKEMTESVIGVDVFETFGVNSPKKISSDYYPEDVRVFYETLDKFLETGEIVDHDPRIERMWISMDPAFGAIEQHIGRSFNQGIMYELLKKTDRFIEYKNNKSSKVEKKKKRLWSFTKIPQSTGESE